VTGESLLTYYAQRAHEYERIYDKPERQPELGRLHVWLRDALVAQALPLDVGHGEPELAGGLARVEHGEDVRMLEPCDGADLALKALRAKARRELGMQDLEGDQPIVLDVAREVDRGHPALAELALEKVAVSESFSELDGDVSHDGGLKWESGICTDSL
jgi:hypothetical protein